MCNTGVGLTASAHLVGRCYLKFLTLPSADCVLISTVLGGPCVRFKSSDSKIYAAGDTSSFGASGVAVGVGDDWYRIDWYFNLSGGTDVCDVQVNGTACGQSTGAGATADTNSILIGIPTAGITADVAYDDFILSFTAADYPIGPGRVLSWSPARDGTHNIAGTGDFQVSLTGTDILNSTGNAWFHIRNAPFETSIGSADFINMIAPPNATDYVECLFAPSGGLSVPNIAPRTVEAVISIAQAATTTGNMEVRLNDNGTQNAIYSATAVAGTTTPRWKRKHYPLAPTGGPWTVTAGAGNFNNLRVRFGSPAVVDVVPDQYLLGVMLEAEYPMTTSLPSRVNSPQFSVIREVR